MVIGRAQVKRVPSPSSSPLRRLRGVLILSLAAIAAGALWLALDARFYVCHADVVGTVRVSPDEVFQASGLSGLHILWVRPAEIEARILAALPGIERVHVACGLSAKCTITVVDRQPQVTWNEDGRLWWIDADGVIFAPQAPAEGLSPEGLLVRGPLPRDEDGRLDERVRLALAELWAAGTNVPPLLDYVPARGLVFIDGRGWRVILGQGPGMEERLRVLEWLVADLEARGLTPRFVDVRFADAPYYSLTNDW
jgi:hypothetical protein